MVSSKSKYLGAVLIGMVAKGSLCAYLGGPDACCVYPEAFNPSLLAPSCCGFSGHIDYLYWRGDEEYIIYRKLDAEAYSFGLFSRDITEKELKFDWDSGFRVGFDYRLPCDCWSVDLSWTHFTNEAQTELRIFDPQDKQDLEYVVNIVVPYSLRDSSYSISDDVLMLNAAARFSLNELSLILKKEFYPTRCVILTPNAGLKWVVVNHRLSYDSNENTIEVGENEATEFRDYKYSNKFTGFGAQAGLDTTFLIGCGLGFYFQGSTALYYGNYDVCVKHEDNATDEFEYRYKYSSCFQKIVGEFNYGAGLKWLVPFNCNQSLFAVHVSWDGKYLMDQNQVPRLFAGDSDFLQDASQAALTLQGITFGVELSF